MGRKPVLARNGKRDHWWDVSQHAKASPSSHSEVTLPLFKQEPSNSQWTSGRFWEGFWSLTVLPFWENLEEVLARVGRAFPRLLYVGTPALPRSAPRSVTTYGLFKWCELSWLRLKQICVILEINLCTWSKFHQGIRFWRQNSSSSSKIQRKRRKTCFRGWNNLKFFVSFFMLLVPSSVV